MKTIDDENVNKIYNESRGLITRRLESKLDIDDDKDLTDILSEQVNEDVTREQIEKMFISVSTGCIKDVYNELDDGYIIINFISLIFDMLVDKYRLRSYELCSRKEFSQSESFIRGLNYEQLNQIYILLVNQFEDGQLSNSICSLRDISRRAEDMFDESGSILSDDISSRRARELIDIIKDCIQFIDSYKILLNSLGVVSRGDKIEDVDFSGTKISSATKCLEDTKIGFIYDIYQHEIRNSIMHGEYRENLSEEIFVFESDNEINKLNYQQIAQFCQKYLGLVYVLMSIPSIVNSEFYLRFSQDEFEDKKLNKINNIETIEK